MQGCFDWLSMEKHEQVVNKMSSGRLCTISPALACTGQLHRRLLQPSAPRPPIYGSRRLLPFSSPCEVKFRWP